ncbi:MAG: radical SAM protein [Candidatus Promineifilaceae bacterium]
MCNLTISTLCNLHCPYCFAVMYMDQATCSATTPFISLDTFAHQLAFLERSGMDQARLIGGEPTLHPQFPALVAMARARGLRVLIFSNGLMPARSLACLETLAPEECLVLLNMNTAHRTRPLSETEQKQRQATMMRLGPRVLLGFNIYQIPFDLEALLPVIQQAHCQPAIRLGLAHPILGGTNAYLSPQQYRLAGEKIVAFAQHAAAYGVTLEFDCGFVRCMFSPAELALLQATGANIGWHCNPILDVGLDGQVIHCFPLTGHIQTNMAAGNAAADLRQILTAKTQIYRQVGIYPECSSCLAKQQGNCTGGCLAHTWRRFRQRPIRLVWPSSRGRERMTLSEQNTDKNQGLGSLIIQGVDTIYTGWPCACPCGQPQGLPVPRQNPEE